MTIQLIEGKDANNPSPGSKKFKDELIACWNQYVDCSFVHRLLNDTNYSLRSKSRRVFHNAAGRIDRNGTGRSDDDDDDNVAAVFEQLKNDPSSDDDSTDL